jgi:hypothetical protein
MTSWVLTTPTRAGASGARAKGSSFGKEVITLYFLMALGVTSWGRAESYDPVHEQQRSDAMIMSLFFVFAYVFM